MSGDVHAASNASPWVIRFASLITLTGLCSTSRAARVATPADSWTQGHDVVAVDRNVSGLDDVREHDRLEVLEVDLESGEPFPLGQRRFAGVVVTNYLYRPPPGSTGLGGWCPRCAALRDIRGPKRALWRPTRPEFLLRPGELLDVVRGRLRVVAFETWSSTIHGPPRSNASRRCATPTMPADMSPPSAGPGRRRRGGATVRPDGGGSGRNRNRQVTTRTDPTCGSTSTVAPSARSSAPAAPTTAGIPSSRANTAA